MSTLTDIANWFRNGIKDVETILVPMAQAVIATIPDVPPEVSKIVAGVPTLMTAMEGLFPSTGSGASKQAAVLGVVQAACDVLDVTLTGGAAASYIKIKPVVVALINAGVALAKVKNVPQIPNSGPEPAQPAA